MGALRMIGGWLWSGLKALGRMVSWLLAATGSVSARGRLHGGDQRHDYDRAERAERRSRWR